MTTSSRVGQGRGQRHVGRFWGRRPGTALSRWVLCGALLAVANGCELFGHDSARCDQSVATVRQAIGFKDFASARTWRAYTWKVCDERGVVATLDKEIVDAEAAAAKEVAEAKSLAQKLARERINAAQKLWRAFDAETPANRNEQTLEATRKSATRLEGGLIPALAQQLRKYNEGEHQKRLAALKR